MNFVRQPETHPVIALERQALERWSKGDPSGFLQITAPDVVYFDPFIDQRIDGLEALGHYYEALRGKIRAEHFELVDPIVQEQADTVVLTFHFRCRLANGIDQRWNCTEVYRRSGTNWRIIQTHWSLTNQGRS
jgi:ketosteroid isomerase-like protein